MELLDLPHCMIENILTFLTYDEIAVNRRVCTLFNEIGSRLLNRGFTITEKRHAAFLKKIKSQLPRRESERRYHPLGRQCEILWCIETRISILNTCYSHFSERGLCCFIPGKILDEVNKLISSLQSMDISTLPQANVLLQELRDLCSMAVEHFREKIAPNLTIKLKDCIKQRRGYVHMDGLNDFSTFINNTNMNEWDKLPYKDDVHLDNDLQNWINGRLPIPAADDTEQPIPPVARTLARINFKLDHNRKTTRGLAVKYRRLQKQVNVYKELASSQNKQMRSLRNIVYKIQERVDAYESKYGEMSKSECNRILSEPRRQTITKRRNSQVDRPQEGAGPSSPPRGPRARPVSVAGSDVPVLAYIRHIMRQSTDKVWSTTHTHQPITKPRRAAVRLSPESATRAPVSAARAPVSAARAPESAPRSPVTVADSGVSAVGYVRHMLRLQTSAPDHWRVTTDQSISTPARNSQTEKFYNDLYSSIKL